MDHPESERVMEKMENIDVEIDNIDITFVKMADPRYARKWGVTKLPSVVFFRKRFPSIYRGSLCSLVLITVRFAAYFNKTLLIFQASYTVKQTLWNGSERIVIAVRSWAYSCTF